MSIAQDHQIELVIFDCDGILVDSEWLAVKVDVEIINELGWAITEREVIERFVGRSNQHMHEEVERMIGRKLPHDFDMQVRPRYRTLFDSHLRAVDGVEELLSQLHLPFCVASSSKHDSIEHKLRLTNLYHHFDCRIFSAQDVRHGKPAPDLFLFAAKRMGVEPSRCAVIEDSPYGIQAAIAAGMLPLGYAHSIVGAAVLQSLGAIMFDDMREVVRMVGA